jgi:hypothetical protein
MTLPLPSTAIRLLGSCTVEEHTGVRWKVLKYMLPDFDQLSFELDE